MIRAELVAVVAIAPFVAGVPVVAMFDWSPLGLVFGAVTGLAVLIVGIVGRFYRDD